MSPSAILFDWDGTICDSGVCARRAFRKSLQEFGLEFTDEFYKSVYTPRWYHMYDKFGLPREHWQQADQRWLHHYSGETPGLVSGAAGVLADLRRRGIFTGMVTNGTRPRIERELAYLKLESAFGAVICHEDVTRSKPDPEGILKAVEAAQCSPQQCWYVGDTPVDIEAGHNAGVFTVALLTDFVDPPRLEAARPGLLLHSLAELTDALYRFTSTTS